MTPCETDVSPGFRSVGMEQRRPTMNPYTEKRIRVPQGVRWSFVKRECPRVGCSMTAMKDHTLRVRLGTLAYHLSEVGDSKQDQKKEPNQEHGPRHIGHVVA